MTRNDLYELESSVNKNIDRIKKEQAEYIKGVEYGIELMFKAVREHLAREEEKAWKEEKEKKDCSNCDNDGKAICRACKQSYDAITRKPLTPTHWQPKESEVQE